MLLHLLLEAGVETPELLIQAGEAFAHRIQVPAQRPELVAVRHIDALPEVAGEAALLVDPYDTDQIARAIATIVNDADLRDELARRGPLQAAKFSVERYRERVAEVYAALR